MVREKKRMLSVFSFFAENRGRDSVFIKNII